MRSELSCAKGELSVFDEKIEKELERNLDAAKVKKRPDGLDYVEGVHIRAELNRIFGAGNWGTRILAQELICEDAVGAKYSVSYSVTMELSVYHNTLVPAVKQENGIGHGRGARGAAHEVARKDAVTDALKRCAMNFGWALGLALYDKDRAHVGDSDDADKQPAGKPARKAKGPVKVSDEAHKLRTVIHNSPSLEELEKLLPILKDARSRLTEIDMMALQEAFVIRRDALKKGSTTNGSTETQTVGPNQSETPPAA